jgi:polyketide synthase-associated protein
MPKLKEVRYDVSFSSSEPTAAQLSSVTSFVTSKGFCAIKWSVPAATLTQVADDVKKLKLGNALKPLPAELDDGFLGAEGSSAMFTNFESNPGLEALEAQLGALTTKLYPTVRAIAGTGAPSASSTSLHVTGEPEDEDDRPELTDDECQKHVALFSMHRLMLVYFIGPGQGSLEMEPLGMLGVNPYVLTTEPGMLVVLRADMLSHRHFSQRPTSAISCFILQESAESGAVRTPSSELLRSFAQERMMTLKGGVEDSQIVPKEWMEEMSKSQVMGPQVACRSISARFPGSWSAKDWWYTTVGGIDYQVEVPQARWSIDAMYDPDPMSYKYFKSCSRHCSYMDGLHLFDNKFFSLSPAETKVMDPQQRHVLEVSYETLNQAGFTKKTLMRSLVGVFLGCSCQMEWGMVDTGGGDGGGAATTGGAASINSNRISFCLGMQGPSYTLDLQAAASMAAITNGYNSQRYQTERFMPCHTALSGGMYLSFVVQNFIMCCAQGFMSNKGRSLTYDATANGWAKGEGLSVMALQKQGDVVDGKTVLDDKFSHCNVAASVMSHVGGASNLNAPNGPVEQAAIHTALRQAQLSPGDIDGLEPVGDGRFLFDASEVMSSSNAYRLNDSNPLVITAVKTTTGMQHETTGMAQVIRIIYSLQAGMVTPMNHLFELNQHIDIWSDSDADRPVQFATEILSGKGVKSFMGASARAHGGTVAHVILGVDVDPAVRPSFVKPAALPSLSFWPGGGGKLEDALKPRESYCIVGSWSRFTEAVPMEKEGKDVYSFFVKIGSNGFEQFQISLDGDLDRMLIPEAPQAAAYTAVEGPVSEEDAKGLHWVIGAPADSGSQTALVDASTSTRGTACPGDTYQVRLRIAGRWRTVDWERVDLARDEGAASSDDGQYFVAGNWNSWACDQELDKVGPGKYQAEVIMASSRDRFQIVRNRDWSQVFYPTGASATGPGTAPYSSSWEVLGASGDVVRITLQRSWQNGSWSQTVTSEKVGSRPENVLKESQWPKYFLAGAGSNVKYELEWAGRIQYSITLQLSQGPVPFQLLYDGDFRRAFYPSVKSANPNIAHKILGPEVAPNKNYSWLIRRDLDDTSEQGGWYTVELTVSPLDHTPTAVRWYRTG